MKFYKLERIVWSHALPQWLSDIASVLKYSLNPIWYTIREAMKGFKYNVNMA